MIPWFQFQTIFFGPLTIQVWGFFVALGMALSFFILWKRSVRVGADQKRMLDLALGMILGGFIGARLFHVFLYEPQFYLSHPWDILKIWHGGLSSFGGLAGAAVIFFLQRNHVPLLPARPDQSVWEEGRTAEGRRGGGSFIRVADLFSFAALYGWMVGRIGCFMIHDHLGVHSGCPLAIRTPSGPRLDMALLEILGLVPLAVFFFVVRKKKMPDGFFTGALFIYYGILRFILDFWRAADIPGADARYAGLTPGQYAGIVLIVAGLHIAKKIKNGEVA